MWEALGELADKVPGWVLLGIVFLLGGSAGALIQALRDIALRVIDEVTEEPPEPLRVLRPIEVLHDSDSMWQALNRLREETGADRVLLLRQENGGKLPTVGRPLTSSIDLEATARGVKPIKMEWQKQLLDSWLVHQLVKMYEAGALEIRPDDAEGITKGSIESAGGQIVHLFPVYSTEGTFYYLSVNFPPDRVLSLDDALYRDRVRVCTGSMVQVFNHWYDGMQPHRP